MPPAFPSQKFETVLFTGYAPGAENPSSAAE